MKTIQIEIPEGKRAEWVNGVLTLVDEKPIEYKFKVGDKVYYDGRQYKIKERLIHCGEPSYKFEGHSFVTQEWLIEISTPKDITERIKTFEDACDWCDKNGFQRLTDALTPTIQSTCDADILAYLRLRIITCALNEGWEPTFEDDEHRYYCICDTDGEALRVVAATKRGYVTPWTLYFKSHKLAEYAAKQFRDIYADFCDCKKGGEE